MEEGVMLFLGSKDGDAGVALWESAGGGGVRIVDKRFRRLASVGLIVRAPSPEACGIVDMRRLDPGAGIADFWVRELGDFSAIANWLGRACSGVKVGFRGTPVETCCRGGGCKDFVFAFLVLLFTACALASCAFRACPAEVECSLLGIGGVREFTEFRDEAMLGRRR